MVHSPKCPGAPKKMQFKRRRPIAPGCELEGRRSATVVIFGTDDFVNIHPSDVEIADKQLMIRQIMKSADEYRAWSRSLRKQRARRDDELRRLDLMRRQKRGNAKKRSVVQVLTQSDVLIAAATDMLHRRQQIADILSL